MGRAAMIALLAVTCALPAFGETNREIDAEYPSIAGHWSFQSETYDGCAFGGTAYFSPPTDTTEIACDLTARQNCVAYEWIVRQSCVAKRSENRLVVESKIEEFLAGEASPAYWPDNFVLTIESGDRMTGVLVSHGTHATEFVRTAEGIS